MDWYDYCVYLNAATNIEATEFAYYLWDGDNWCHSFPNTSFSTSQRCGMDLPNIFFVCVRRPSMHRGEYECVVSSRNLFH